jgi:acyl-homoserine lactone synthase
MTGGPRPPEAELFADMFRTRKRVFIDLLGWDVPVLEGQYEIDQFDSGRAIYLIIAEPDGRHRGSMRLLPTTEPNILGSIFPFLCEGDPPCSPDIWEISRFCLSPRLRANERRIVRDELVSSAVDFALLHGISAYACVADASWLSQILSFGWHCEPLGLPQALDCGLTGALQIFVSPATPKLMRAAATYRSTTMQIFDLASKVAA